LNIKIPLWLWLSGKLLVSHKKMQLGFSGWVSLLSLTLGVGVLVVAMGLFSGFERTLQTALTDVTGHAQVFWAGASEEQALEMRERLIEKTGPWVSSSLMSNAEGVMISKGKIKGVFIRGVEANTVQKTLNLQSRVVAGRFLDPAAPSEVLLGKALAQEMKVKIGDVVRIVVPLSHEIDPGQIRRQMQTFKLVGVVDLGKYEFDERFVIMDLKGFQNFLQTSGRTSGLMVRLTDIQNSENFVTQALAELGYGYRVLEWKDINANLFEAVRLERVVIFFVLLIIVIAAAFNVTGALFNHVIQKTAEVSLLRALGFTKKDLLKVFAFQGFILGLIGSIAGVMFGWCLGIIFEAVQTSFHILPAETYRLSHIKIDLRFIDLASVFIATSVVCVVAALAPAIRASQFKPVEGLRHE
jgi:lipoprotein-releasing system permease protein